MKGAADKKDKAVCAHSSPNGPCKAFSQVGSKWCYFHDPALAGERALVRKKGGMNSHRRSRALPVLQGVKPPESLGDVAKILSETMAAVLSGQLDTRTGNSISYQARNLVECLKVGVLESRLRKVEDQLEKEGK